MKLNSIYVGVRDMRRAADFYQELLGMKISNYSDRFSEFDIGGFSFCLYDSSKDGDEMLFGNNCVPDFQVENIGEKYAAVKKAGGTIASEIADIDGMKIFQFRDTEGNVIEFYE
jgi:predicted enzyme related to lactoylglutathione lyase